VGLLSIDFAEEMTDIDQDSVVTYRGRRVIYLLRVAVFLSS
jgi:hypothetical protein